jgi:hypothetical protein
MFAINVLRFPEFRTMRNKEIPPYFKNQSVPIVFYSYTNSIGRKIFNYKEALQNINIEEYLKNPLTWTLTQDLGLLLSLSTFWHNLQQHP